MKAFLIPIAADTSNLGYVGPVFLKGNATEGPFEYLPITEDDYPSNTNPTYNHLLARNQEYGRKLGCFVLKRDTTRRVHHDPKFSNKLFTYGEGSKAALKANGRLKTLHPNDLVFFWSTLAPHKLNAYKNKNSLCSHQRRFANKYVIGFFTIRGLRHVVVGKDGEIAYKELDNRQIGKIDIEAVKRNQHFLDKKETEFLVIQGDTERSALLRIAVRMTERKIKTAGGKKRQGWTYKLNPLGQEVLGKPSYTRGIRTNIDEDGIKRLISAIKKKNREIADRLP